MVKVEVYGMKLELCRILTPEQANYIDANLKLHKKILFTLFGDVNLHKTPINGYESSDMIALVKDKRGKWLGIRRASGSIRWNG